MIESQVERQLGRYIDDWAQANGISVVYFKIQAALGWPDRMVMWDGGHVMFVELKRPGEKPRPAQLHIHKILRNMGFIVEVHDNAREALDSIKRHIAESGIPSGTSEI